VLRKLCKNLAQTVRCGEPKIRGWQFSLFEDPKFPARITDSGYSLHQHPSGFGSPAFDPEDALTGFHDSLCLASFVEN
jgi:hypothetical protein